MSESICNKRTFKKKWSLAELENLQLYYAQKMTLKHMSLKLKRSISSINKMLERQGIRQKRLSHYTHHRGKKFTNGYQNKKMHIKSMAMILKEHWRSESSFEDSWVGMTDVVNLLSHHGNSIRCCQQYCTTSEFVMNGLRMTPAQLLIEANRVRYHKNMGPLYVDGITAH